MSALVYTYTEKKLAKDYPHLQAEVLAYFVGRECDRHDYKYSHYQRPGQIVIEGNILVYILGIETTKTESPWDVIYYDIYATKLVAVNLESKRETESTCHEYIKTCGGDTVFSRPQEHIINFVVKSIDGNTVTVVATMEDGSTEEIVLTIPA